MSQEFCWGVPDPWGCSKSSCKKSSSAIFVPYVRGGLLPKRLTKRYQGEDCFQRQSLINLSRAQKAHKHKEAGGPFILDVGISSCAFFRV